MAKKLLKVALRLSRLSVPGKINRGRHLVESIGANVKVFQKPSPSLAVVTSAIDDLEQAWNEAEDGGKSKKAIMRDRERDVVKLLTDLAHYVEALADGDEEIVHLAGMEVKDVNPADIPDFSVVHAADRGAVRLRVKPRAKTFYRWEYCEGHLDHNSFVEAKKTSQCITSVGDLKEGVKYWFRVVFETVSGDIIPYDPISIIVI